MQAKLTLRMEEELINTAKLYSARSGKSVSKIVADLFKLTSDINFFLTFNVTSNQQLSLPLGHQLALLHN